MRLICRLRKKHWWGQMMLIPPSGPWLYAMRICMLCGRIEYSRDSGKSWTDKPDPVNDETQGHLPQGENHE